MKKKLPLLALAALTLCLGLTLLSCGDTSTNGNPRNNWEINVLLARNGETGFVSVYAEIFKNDAAFISAVLKIDEQSVQSLGDGKYSANLNPALLEDTSEISITTPLEAFQFKQLVVVPDTFSFNFDQLPNNQVFSSTSVVNVRWNASDFHGTPGAYFIVTEPTSSSNTAVGSFDLFSATQGSIPPDGFRDSQGNFKTGTYNVWVVSRVEQPIASPNIPFTIKDGVFSKNISRVGVTGQYGAIYISPRKILTGVAGSFSRMGRRLYEQLKTLTTESRNKSSRDLDRLNSREIIELINREDHFVADAVARVIPEIARTAELVANSFQSGGRLIYAGAGTSGRLGVLDAAECPPTFGTPPRMVQAVIAGGRQTLVRSREGVEDNESAAIKDIAKLAPIRIDTIVGIAASGRTPYPLAVLKYAKRQKAKTVFLVCNEILRKPAFVDILIAPVVGPEVLTGSTRMKAGTATKLILNMISTAAMVQIGKCYGNLMVDLRATSQKLTERSRRILVETLGINYADAGALLTESHGEVKTAIAMHLLSLNYDSAKRLLKRAGGKLSRALDPHL